MYVKSGVDLSGTPLAVLKETKTESAKESAAVRKRGKALFKLSMSKADRVASSGRSAFVGSLFSGFGTAGLGAYQVFKS
jgi:hypothetical protein